RYGRALWQDPAGHQNRLGSRRGAVVHAGVGDFERGQLRDHRLELEDCLRRALARLGLVWGVAGGEFRTRDYSADGGRHVMAIAARTEEADEDASAAVLVSQGGKFGDDFGFRASWG